jgi:predicted PurR-regulated permease PerM
MRIDPPIQNEIIDSKREATGLVAAVASAILAAMIIAALYFGRDIFVPMALAILLTFVLAPAVHALQHIRVPRSLAVVGVVLCAFACILGLASLFAAQLNDLAGELPKYQTTISQKISSLRSTTAGRGTLERASDMLKDLSKELDKPAPAVRSGSPGP